MKEPRKIIIIGPLPEPTTGVSLANKVVYNILKEHPDYEVSAINTSYTRFDEALGKFTMHKLLFNLSYFFKAFRVISKEIIYITPGQTFFGVLKYAGFILLGSLFQKKIIIHVHGNHLGNEYRQLTGLKKKIFYFLLSKTTKGVVLSESLKLNMTPFIADENVVVLQNFAEDYIAAKAPLKSFEKLQIIYLSNLMKEKGIYDLIGALRLLEQSGIPYEAKVAGAIDSSQKSEIEKGLTTLENTSYLGIVKGTQKKELLDWGNVFVLPTYYQMEGQPISILEALATGNVILTTAHSGIPDIIRDGVHGSFFNKQDPQDLYDTLKQYHTHREKLKEISSGNKNYFSENFTRLQFKEKLLEIL